MLGALVVVSGDSSSRNTVTEMIYLNGLPALEDLTAELRANVFCPL